MISQMIMAGLTLLTVLAGFFSFTSALNQSSLLAQKNDRQNLQLVLEKIMANPSRCNCNLSGQTIRVPPVGVTSAAGLPPTVIPQFKLDCGTGGLTLDTVELGNSRPAVELRDPILSGANQYDLTLRLSFQTQNLKPLEIPLTVQVTDGPSPDDKLVVNCL